MNEKTFPTTREHGGYEVAEVDQFRTDMVDLVTILDNMINELHKDLAAARMRLADASVEQGRTNDTRQEAPVAAGRLLELAALTADQLVTDAMGEADSVLSGARAEAEELIMASRAEAERVTAELARHSEKQTAELDQHRSSALAEVEALRRLESEHRNHLRHHLAEQLSQLEGPDPAPPGHRRMTDVPQSTAS